MGWYEGGLNLNLKRWNTETLKRWNAETLKHWNIENMKFWNPETINTNQKKPGKQ